MNKSNWSCCFCCYLSLFSDFSPEDSERHTRSSWSLADCFSVSFPAFHASLLIPTCFPGVLPPLLYAAAWTTSWREFRYNLVSISLLAFGLVAFTVVAIALIAPSIFDGFDWRLGFVLGAVVAPTDAIAATAIARRVGLPARIVHILEGESLINDATGLLALQFAIAIVVQKAIPTVSERHSDLPLARRPAVLAWVWLSV